MKLSPTILALTLVAASVASSGATAQTFLFTGALFEGDTAVSDLVDLDLSIVDADSTTVWQETQSNVVVAGGFFAVDVGAVTPIDVEVSLPATLVVVVDGDALPAIPLATLVQAERVARAARVQSATQTDRLAGRTVAEVATRAGLSTGGAPFPFANIAGVPPGVEDGDDGVEVTNPTDGISLANRTLSLASVNGDRFATNSINATRFATGSITSAKIAAGSLTGADVAGDLTRADLTADIGEAQVAGRDIFRVGHGCEVPFGSLMTTATCRREGCTTLGGQSGRKSCTDAEACDITFIGQPSTCTNTRVGKLVAP